MRRSAFAAKGLRGSGFTPAKPTFSHTADGQFTIDNYNAQYQYSVSVSAGTFTRSGAVITLSATDAILYVTPTYVLTGLTGQAERKAYTYSCRQVGYTCCSSCNCRAVCTGGCSTNSSCGGYGQCGCSAPAIWFCGTVTVECDSCCGTCYNTVCDVLIDQPGYTNSGTEWFKVA